VRFPASCFPIGFIDRAARRFRRTTARVTVREALRAGFAAMDANWLTIRVTPPAALGDSCLMLCLSGMAELRASFP
jgi:hypothetical protein